MAKITEDEIRKLARLCRLHLDEAEITKLKTDLSNILEYVEMLKNVDVSDLEPTSQVTGLQNVYRLDVEVNYSASPDELLKNAPAQKDHQFKVKRII
jgi:aspartyl-tRNA(Asn)/glutamyl-tRNA(Gln) amidotransferase subunit C